MSDVLVRGIYNGRVRYRVGGGVVRSRQTLEEISDGLRKQLDTDYRVEQV